MSIAAINVSCSRERDGFGIQETQEAKESRMRKEYSNLLRLRAEGRCSDARKTVDDLLDVLQHTKDERSEEEDRKKTSPFEKQLLFLALKQSSELHELEGNRSWKEAIRCIASALRIQPKDVSLWRRLGRICLRNQAYAEARNALECGLKLRPDDPLSLQSLMEALVAARDRNAASRVAVRLLQLDQGNQRAKHVARISMDHAGITMPSSLKEWHALEREWEIERKRKRWHERGGSNDAETKDESEELGTGPEIASDKDVGFGCLERNLKTVVLPQMSWRALVRCLIVLLEPAVSSSTRNLKRMKRGTSGAEQPTPPENLHEALPEKILFTLAEVDKESGKKVQVACDSQALTQNGHVRVEHASQRARETDNVADCRLDGSEPATSGREERHGDRQGEERESISKKGHRAKKPTRISARLAQQCREDVDLQRSSHQEPEDYVSQILSCFSPSPEIDDIATIEDAAANASGRIGIVDPSEEALPGSDEIREVRQFLWEHKAIASSEEGDTVGALGCSPMRLVAGLLKLSLDGTLVLESLAREDCNSILQLEHLCRFGGATKFMDDLALAEIHTNVALQKIDKRENSTAVVERLTDAELHLATACACKVPISENWINVAQEYGAKDELPYWIRFFWVCAGISEVRKDRARASMLYHHCCQLLRQGQGKSVGLRIPRPHCLLNPYIDEEVANAKAQSLHIFLIMKKAHEKLQQGTTEGIVQELVPLLIPRYASESQATAAGEMHSTVIGSFTLKERMEGLRTLQEAAEHPNNGSLVALFGSLLEQLILSSTHYVTMLGKGKSDANLRRRKRFLGVAQSCLDHLQRYSANPAKGTDHIVEAASEAGMLAVLSTDVRKAAPTLVEALKLELQSVSSPGTKLTQRCRKAEISMNHKGASVDIACLLCNLYGLDRENAVDEPSACASLINSIHSMLAEKGICCASSGAVLKSSIIQLSLMKKRIVANLMEKEHLSSIAEVQQLLQEADSEEYLDGEDLQRKNEGNFEESISSQSNGTSTVEHAKLLIQDLDREVFQCIRCLYGVDLLDGCLMAHENIGSVQLNSKQACCDVWEQIQPILADRPDRAAKMTEILTDISSQFPPLTDEQLEAETGVAIRLFLDGDIDEEGFLKGSKPAQLEPASHQETERNIHGKERELYAHLYRYLHLARNESLEELEQGQLLSVSRAIEAVDRSTQWLRVNLSFNPECSDSWLRLAACYEDATDIILNDGALVLSPSDWPQHMDLWKLTSKFRASARRCFLAARLNAPNIKSQCSAEEYLGQNLYEALQDSPPLCDLHVRPSWRAMQGPRDAFQGTEKVLGHPDHWQEVAWTAGLMFDLARRGFSNEWICPFYKGKVIEKVISNADPSTLFAAVKKSTALALYARAVYLARTFDGGLLEPFYRLHASRLKMLVPLSTRKDGPLHLSQHLGQRAVQSIGANLLIVARHCFLPTTAEQACSILKEKGINFSVDQLRDVDHEDSDSSMKESVLSSWMAIESQMDDEAKQKVWDLLFEDCASAMRFCISRHKYFHKAPYRLAAAYAASGALDNALNALRVCFTQKHKLFSVQMWEINDISLGAGARKKRLKRPSKSLAISQVSLEKQQMREEHLTFGCEASISGVGCEEPARRWVACIRKYCMLYLKLLEISSYRGSIYSFKCLEAAAQALQDGSSQHAYMQDVKECAVGMYLKILSSVLSGHVLLDMVGCKDELGPDALESPARETLLEKAYGWYVEISSREAGWEGSIQETLAILNPLENQGSRELPCTLQEDTFFNFAVEYLAILAARMDAERLSALAATLRKKLKFAPEQCITRSSKLCSEVTMQLTKAATMKLACIESKDDENSTECKNEAFLLAHEWMVVYNWRFPCVDPGIQIDVVMGTSKEETQTTQAKTVTPTLLQRLAHAVSGELLMPEAASIYCKELTRIKRRSFSEACNAASSAVEQSQEMQLSGSEKEDSMQE